MLRAAFPKSDRPQTSQTDAWNDFIHACGQLEVKGRGPRRGVPPKAGPARGPGPGRASRGFQGWVLNAQTMVLGGLQDIGCPKTGGVPGARGQLATGQGGPERLYIYIYVYVCMYVCMYVCI